MYYTVYNKIDSLFMPSGKLFTAEEILEMYPILNTEYGICKIIGQTLMEVSNISILMNNYGIQDQGSFDKNLEAVNRYLNLEEEEEEIKDLTEYEKLLINHLDRIALALELQNKYNSWGRE